jgi:hypothetical protein
MRETRFYVIYVVGVPEGNLIVCYNCIFFVLLLPYSMTINAQLCDLASLLDGITPLVAFSWHSLVFAIRCAGATDDWRCFCVRLLAGALAM